MGNSGQKKYGCGVNPPYSLYQASDGLWGLTDGSGNKLEPVFTRNGDFFQCVPWEVVVFDEKEGFELQSWYDPGEVWFNFTFGNPDYPEEYEELLWKARDHKLKEYADRILQFLPEESHRLINLMLQFEQLDEDTEDDETEQLANVYKSQLPELKEPAKLNLLLEPVMSNKEIDETIRKTLWQSKVSFDLKIIQ